MNRAIRIANCSGFFGDRLSAAREMVDGGPIDMLTGDWLAELTMLILARQRMKHGAGAGYARTFLTQMEQVLGTCLDRGIRVVSNAGGLDPSGLAEALQGKAAELGLSPVIAVVEGDDLMPRMAELRERTPFANLDSGESFDGIAPITANAYIGSHAVAMALEAGADIVITGRITDAGLVVGPAAWWHGWDLDSLDDIDALAGAVVAGHVIECGAQATGGNYSFFRDVPGLEHPGFPIAEVEHDGSSVITKHDGTGGLVSVGTVTAQLLYEIGAPLYLNPDASARFDSIRLEQVGRDRVRISGVKGVPAPSDCKVAVNYLGGFRNAMTLAITGLDVEDKADLAVRTVTGLTLAECRAGSPEELGPRSRLGVRELDVALDSHESPDPTTTFEAQALLRITVKDGDPAKVGKPFTTSIVESALSSYPGMSPTAPPADGTPYGVYWPTTVPASLVDVSVTLHGAEWPDEPTSGQALVDGVAALPMRVLHRGLSVVTAGLEVIDASLDVIDAGIGIVERGLAALGPSPVMTRAPLGRVVGSRSGDKGGAANVGLWIPDPHEPQAVAWAHDRQAPLVDPADVERADAAYAWLAGWLTPDRVRELLPEARDLRVEVHLLPNLRAVNVVIHGLLGRGVADATRLDPQAKGLGEHLRARVIDVPAFLVGEMA